MKSKNIEIKKNLSSPLKLSSQNQPNTTPSNFWLAAQTNARLKHQFPIIKPVSRNSKLPLSLHQERLWSIEQLQPNTSVHNLLHTIRFIGSLNITALKQSLEEITQRHEILRTSFLIVDGQPFQSVIQNYSCELNILDLQNLASDQKEAEVQRLALEDAEEPFNLANGPLWRFKLLRLADDDHVLIRTVHHIIFDGWSHSVFMRELGSLYQAFSTGKPSPLFELPIQYADFAHVQQQWLQSTAFTTQLDYWKQQLSGSVSPLELPTDYPRPLLPSYSGGCQSLTLSEELTEALKGLSYQQGVSLFVTLLTAFKVWLYCYTRQDDMIVCSPVVGRHRPETKGLIGYFNNVVVMRTDLSGNPSFRELLGQVSQVSVDACANQDVPLQKLAELPELASIPLNRGMFILQNTPNQNLNLEGLTITSQYVERPIANFDLSLSVQEKAGKLTAVLQYKTDLFADTSMGRMLKNFQTLLERLVTNPDWRLSDLPLFATTTSCQGSKKREGLIVSKRPPFVPPRNEIECQLAEIWEQVLHIHPIGVQDNLFALGANSLLAVRLCDRIEQVFQKKLSLVTIFQAPTIEQLSNFLQQEDRSQTWRSLTPIQARGSKPPLFLCEGVGIYYPLIPYLGSDQPIYGLVAGSHKGKPILYESLEDLAAHYIEEMRTLQPEGPYFLGGISWGGVAAFEIAQQLVSQGQEVALLALFDTIRPGAYQPKPIAERLLWHVKNLLKYGPSYALVKVQGTLLKGVKSRLYENLSNVEDLSSPENQMMPVPQNEEHFTMRQTFNRACQNYVPTVYPDKVTIFVASDRKDAGAYDIEPGLGWATLAAGGLEVEQVPGDHLSILQEPHVAVLGKKLKACLERANKIHADHFEGN